MQRNQPKHLPSVQINPNSNFNPVSAMLSKSNQNFEGKENIQTFANTDNNVIFVFVCVYVCLCLCVVFP